jgi:S1-C subfamily serine protease
MLTSLLVIYGLITSFLLLNHETRLDENRFLIRKTSEAIVSLETAGGRGTGFLVKTKSGKKVIVTNAHVCEMGRKSPLFFVYHRNGTQVRERLKLPTIPLKIDDKHDLCIMAAPPDLTAKPLKLADDVFLDERVYILGYPVETLLSTSEGFIRGNTIIDTLWVDDVPIDQCVGTKLRVRTVPIKQANGQIVLTKMCFIRAVFLFTDALGDHGASGGPALNNSGEVVGVMSMIGGDARPFAFLVPLKNLREFLSTN